MAWITGFFENPLVEGKPGQLTIDLALRGQQGRCFRDA